jgi:hypothetical protein
MRIGKDRPGLFSLSYDSNEMQFENNEDSCDAQILTRIIFYSQVYECIRESHEVLYLGSQM